MINIIAHDTEIAITSPMTTLTNHDNYLSPVEPRFIQDTNVEEDLLSYARSPVSVFTGRNLIGSTPIMTMVPNLDFYKSRISNIDSLHNIAAHFTSPALGRSNNAEIDLPNSLKQEK